MDKTLTPSGFFVFLKVPSSSWAFGLEICIRMEILTSRGQQGLFGFDR
jgi:hypothetical protein